MTCEAYLAALAELNLKPTSRETARLIGLSVRQCQNIAAGRARVPGPVVRLLAMYRYHGTRVVRAAMLASEI